MSKEIFYESADGAVGYITDVTNEDFYKNPRMELYDGLEQDCFELVCDFAELIGVKLDKEEPDFYLANHIRDTIINLLEKEFGIPFPVHGESDIDRGARIAEAKVALFKLEHQEQYDDLCELADQYDDVCISVDVEEKEFIIDSGSSESLKAIVKELGISANNVYNSPVNHEARVKAGEEQKLDLEEQIARAEAKEYELTFCQGKENEKTVRVSLTDEQVSIICKKIGGKADVGDHIVLLGGERMELRDINAIEALDSDYLLPERHQALGDKERE